MLLTSAQKHGAHLAQNFPFLIFRDRVCTHLDHIVPLDSTKAYDMRDVIYAVSILTLVFYSKPYIEERS